MHRPRRATTHRLFTALAALAAGVMLLAGCTAANPDGGAAADAMAETMLAEHGLAGLDARQIIDQLDAMPLSERPDDLIVSVRADELFFADASENEWSLPMPDQFYASVAPYVSQTHDCFFHSLTTCVGEQRNVDVHVTVIDDNTGETVLDEARTTFDNGFVGLWLPRGIQGTLTVVSDQGTARVPIDTTSDETAATCLTEARLT